MSNNLRLEHWSGKRAWIVGASSGIGRAVAVALLQRGASVAVSARSIGALAQLAQEHPACTAVPLDANEPMQVASAARELLAHGPLDLVMYCVGHYQAQRATAFDLDQMIKHQRVNYEGALHTLAAVLPAFLERGQGHISLVGSVAGYSGLPNGLAYGPTKAALINLAQSLHFDLRPRGLGVSIVNPGFVETPLTAQNSFHMPAMIQPDEAAAEILRGWAKGEFEIHFPKRFSFAVKSLALLPFRWRQAVLHRVTGL